MPRRSTDQPSPDPASEPSLEGFLCFAIYSTGLAFGRVYRPFLEATNLTYLQYLLMVVLWERDDRTVGDLCEALFLTTSTITPVLRKLETRGLLRRARSLDDERRVHVVLTPAGTALKGEAQGLPDCIRAATGLDGEAMRTLHTAVASLRDHLLASKLPEARAASRSSGRASPRRPRPAPGSTRVHRRGAG